MKKVFVLSSVVCATLSVSGSVSCAHGATVETTSPDESIVVNASFSRGSALPDGWNLSKDSKANLARDTSTHKSEPASLRIDATGNFTVQQNWKSAPKQFTLSGSTKTTGVIANLKYDLQVFDSGWKQLAWITSEDNDSHKLKPSEEWKEFRRDISLPDGAANVVFYFGGSGNGSAWLDDLS